MDLLKARKRLNEIAMEVHFIDRTVYETREKLKLQEEKLANLYIAQQLVQQVVKEIQDYAHKQISSLVTRCLRAIFPDPYEFKIVFETKRGKTDARLVFERNGLEADWEAVGGGVVDVAAFALRLSTLILKRPALREIMLLDEPFKYLSKQYRPAAAELLTALADELRIQFVIITHDSEFQLGKIIAFL